jgi:hypothetical protein
MHTHTFSVYPVCVSIAPLCTVDEIQFADFPPLKLIIWVRSRIFALKVYAGAQFTD